MTSDPRTILGRADEIDAVRTFLGAIRDGPGALVLTGEPGIGKSTIWREGLRLAREADLPVLQCRPVESEAQLSFTALADLLVDASDDDLAQLPAPQRRALEFALLRAEPDGIEIPPRAVAVGVLALLRHLAAPGPIVVAVDDAHWMDQPSQRVLSFVARRLRDERVGLLLTERTAGTNGVVTGLDPDVDMRVVERHVAAMQGGELDAVLQLRLGSALAPRHVRTVQESSGGNPMFALHLAQAVIERGAPADGAPIPLPDTLLSVVGERLDELGPAIEVVQVAAMISRPTAATIRAVLGPAAIDQLRVAEAAGVVADDGGRIVTTHPLLGSAAYARLDRPRRIELHARIAATLDDVEEQGRHLALSTEEPDADVARRLDDAARRAEARGAPDAAADMWRAAARLTPHDAPDAERERRLHAARCGFGLGRVAQAKAELDAVLDGAPAGPTRWRALELRAWAVASLHGFDAAAQSFGAALGELDAGSEWAIGILHGLAWTVHHSDVQLAESHARHALALADERGTDEQVAVSRTLVEFLASLAGNGGAIDLDEEPAAPPGPYRPQIMCHPHWLRGLLLMWQDRVREALDLFVTTLEDVTALGDEQSLPFVLYNIARAELLLGEWRDAVATAARCEASLMASGQESERPFTLLASALVHGHLGQIADAEREIEEGLMLAARFGLRNATTELLAARAFLETSTGRYDDADRTLTEVARLAERTGLREPGLLRVHGDAIEAKIALGRLDDAEQLLDAADRLAARLRRPWLDMVVDRGRGMALAARGDLGSATAVLIGALEADRTQQPFERARTQLALGTVHRRNRQKRAARDAFSAAKVEFDRLGAALWSERVRAESSRIGGRATSDELTPTERQVAELIAAGKSYREVAAELFISPKTVQWNLSKVYRKLGIRSRAELPGRLQAG